MGVGSLAHPHNNTHKPHAPHPRSPCSSRGHGCPPYGGHPLTEGGRGLKKKDLYARLWRAGVVGWPPDFAGGHRMHHEFGKESSQKRSTDHQMLCKYAKTARQVQACNHIWCLSCIYNNFDIVVRAEVVVRHRWAYGPWFWQPGLFWQPKWPNASKCPFFQVINGISKLIWSDQGSNIWRSEYEAPPRPNRWLGWSSLPESAATLSL